MTPKIITEHRDLGPLPPDWVAYFDGDEPNDDGNMRHGCGRTEQKAIEDLLENAHSCRL